MDGEVVMTSKVLIFAGMLLGQCSCTMAFEISAEMSAARLRLSRSVYESAIVWENNRLSGKYLIADMVIAREVCCSIHNDVESLLGFCQCRLNYRYPSKSNRES